MTSSKDIEPLLKVAGLRVQSFRAEFLQALAKVKHVQRELENLHIHNTANDLTSQRLADRFSQWRCQRLRDLNEELARRIVDTDVARSRMSEAKAQEEVLRETFQNLCVHEAQVVARRREEMAALNHILAAQQRLC